MQEAGIHDLTCLESADLEDQIASLELKLSSLRKRQRQIRREKRRQELLQNVGNEICKSDVERYCRHLALEGLGAEGQKRILNTSVLIVGAGGLACSAAMYLSGAGVGRIGVVDFDTVDLSNLQRQPIYRECCVSKPKAELMVEYLSQFNSFTELDCHNVKLSSSNALEILSPYDIVLDCTDNAPTRYLINDACVLSKKCLVSGSALRFEGQITVLGLGDDGPCYRCLYPSQPSNGGQDSCNSEGVLGVVPGIIGMLQALECLKIAGGFGEPLSRKLLHFNALHSNFRVFELRSRMPSCSVCGINPTITTLSCQYDHATCGNSDDCGALPHVTVKEYSEIRQTQHVLLDVRPRKLYQIRHLEPSINIPLSEFEWQVDAIKELLHKNLPIYVICRIGATSKIAVSNLIKMGLNAINIQGGYHAWSKEVDHSFPCF